MKIILTGGAGFIGNCLLWLLNQKGYQDITIVDHLGTSLKWHNLENKKFSDYIEKDDFLEKVKQDRIPPGIDLMIHFGACTSTVETDASYMIRNNYTYSKVLAEWAVAHHVRFMYASSAAVYGNGESGYSDDDAAAPAFKPLNMYGYSKQLFDRWVLRNNLQSQVVGFRFFNVFGPNEYHKGEMRSIIAKRFETVSRNGIFKLFKSYRQDYADGEQRRDFIYVKDAIDIVYFFIQHPEKSGIYNVGTGNARTWNEVAHALFMALNKKSRIEYIDMPENLKNIYQYFTQAELKKLRAAGYTGTCTDLDDAVKDYAGYLKNNSCL